MYAHGAVKVAFAVQGDKVAFAVQGDDLRSFKTAPDKVNCRLFSVQTFTHKQRIRGIFMKYLFSMVIWGEEYAREFLELSLPSQLAEGNIDGSAWHDGSEYLILTTKADSEIIKAHPAFHLLQKRLKVRFAIFGRRPLSEMYKLASQCQMEAIRVGESFDAVFFSYPDFIWSQGGMGNVAARIAEGCDAVLSPVPRAITEDMAEILPKLKTPVPDSPTPTVLNLSSRDLVQLSLENFHQGMWDFCWDTPKFSVFPSTVMWKIPDQGILMRSYHLHPLVIRSQPTNIDYYVRFSVSLDEEYMPILFKGDDNIHYVEDSDECTVISLSNRATVFSPDPNRPSSSVPVLARWAEEYASVLHRFCVKHSLRWHHAPVDEQLWEAAEGQAEEIVSAVAERLSVPGEILRFEDIPASAARERRIKRFSHWRRRRPVYSIPTFLMNMPWSDLFKVTALRTVSETIGALKRSLMLMPALYRAIRALLMSPLFKWMGGLWVLMVKRYKGGLSKEKLDNIPPSVCFRAILSKAGISGLLPFSSAITFVHDDSD